MLTFCYKLCCTCCLAVYKIILYKICLCLVKLNNNEMMSMSLYVNDDEVQTFLILIFTQIKLISQIF